MAVKRLVPGRHRLLEAWAAHGSRRRILSHIFLDQFIVLEENSNITVYRNWFQDYTQEPICEEIEGGGFIIDSIWCDLLGSPYHEDTEWIGVVAQKASQ